MGISLATLGKALVLKETKENGINKICSGEVRYNTDEYVKLISRLQAAQNIKTHLPFGNNRTSIWMASFLIFMLDYDGGEYVTSSHALSSKTATKDLDDEGSQFIPEISSKFVDKIDEILKIAETSDYKLQLGPADSKYIVKDFDGFDMYVDYLKRGIASETNLKLILLKKKI